MEVKPLDDVMFHFQWVFFAYAALLVVVVGNFFKAIYINNSMKKDGKTIQVMDLVIDVICGLAMAAGFMFQGVLADNNAVGYEIWGDRLLLIAFSSLVVFILNVIIVFIPSKRK